MLAIYGLLWVVMGVPLYGALYLIVLYPKELLEEYVPSKRVGRFLGYGYAFISGTVCFSGTTVRSPSAVFKYTSSTPLCIIDKNYTDRQEVEEIIDVVLGTYPNWVLAESLEAYITFGGVIWAYLLVVCSSVIDDIPQWVNQYKDTYQSIPTRIKTKHNRRFIEHYWREHKVR